MTMKIEKHPLISEATRIAAWLLFGTLPLLAFALGAEPHTISGLGALVIGTGLFAQPHLGRRVRNLLASARSQNS